MFFGESTRETESATFNCFNHIEGNNNHKQEKNDITNNNNNKK